jgi:hypothetical protein
LYTFSPFYASGFIYRVEAWCIGLHYPGYGFDCRLYNEAYEHTKGDHYATNIVEQVGVCSLATAALAYFSWLGLLV